MSLPTRSSSKSGMKLPTQKMAVPLPTRAQGMKPSLSNKQRKLGTQQTNSDREIPIKQPRRTVTTTRATKGNSQRERRHRLAMRMMQAEFWLRGKLCLPAPEVFSWFPRPLLISGTWMKMRAFFRRTLQRPRGCGARDAKP